MDQELLRLHLAMTESSLSASVTWAVSIPLIQRPADDAGAEQVEPDSEIPPAEAGAEVGDNAGPEVIRRCWLELLLQQVLHYANSTSALP